MKSLYRFTVKSGLKSRSKNHKQTEQLMEIDVTKLPLFTLRVILKENII